MQICAEIAKTRKVLYVSGEESAGQVKLRAERLGAKSEKLNFAATTSANDIAKTIESAEFDLHSADPSVLSRYRKLPGDLASAKKAAASSSFIREHIPAEVLRIYGIR